VAGGRTWPHKNSPGDVQARRRVLRALPHWDPADDFVFDWPVDPQPFLAMQECTVGYVALPVAAVGPLALELGSYRVGDDGELEETGRIPDQVYVPLAHTEGSLSMSVLRGANAARPRGIRTHVVADGITRDCCFVFEDSGQALALSRWVRAHVPEMRAWLEHPDNSFRAERLAGPVAPISRHAKLQRVDTFVLGAMCHLLLRFTTGDACGPNMITRNSYALCHGFITERFTETTGIRPQRFVLEANMGGDKKPSFQYFHEGHGKSVIAETVIDAPTLSRVLRVQVRDLVELEAVGLHGSHASGMPSFAFTPASAIAAIFAATGQDLGMIGTSSMAHGAVQAVDVDGLPGVHVSVRLPGLEVGTLGGGTHLPHARAYLNMLGCDGPGRVYRFAQIIAATTLCLEISAAAAMATSGSRNFWEAHLERGGLRLKQAESALPGNAGPTAPRHPRERRAKV
jgi:hydroxymethylglutaryl-CoA reductase (NADPH)